MPRLIILRGNSGSGKTAAAGILQKKLGPDTMRISHDMVRMEILHVRGRQGVERSLPLMTELMRYGRSHSEFTIMEGILPYEDYEPLFEAALEEYGRENIFAYYYDIPFGETLRRHRTKPNHEDFGEEDMRRWWQEKDYLENIEETVFKEDISLEGAVEKIYRDVFAGNY